jgi:hypothetical protein
MIKVIKDFMVHLKEDSRQDIKIQLDQSKDGLHKSFYQQEQIEVL